MKRELKENPEFFKAFPHLQEMFNKEGEMRKYHTDKTLDFADPNREETFFNGLLQQHNNYMKPKENPEELLRDNEKNLIEGSMASPDGPLKYMERKVIDQIHRVIDVRMQELEDSGLSRTEILYDDPKSGVPLKDDVFFQLIKSNWTVREMLIKPNEEFSADRVIEKALRQDVGVDPSKS